MKNIILLALAIIAAIVVIAVVVYFVGLAGKSTYAHHASTTIKTGYNVSGYNQSGINQSGYNRTGYNTSVPKTNPYPP